MQEKVQRLTQLRKLREAVNAEPQTVQREFDAARLDMEIIALECEVHSVLAKRVILFLDAWRKTGMFEAIRFDGARMKANPVVTGRTVQDFWNVRSEAHSLANWSIGISSPYVV